MALACGLLATIVLCVCSQDVDPAASTCTDEQPVSLLQEKIGLHELSTHIVAPASVLDLKRAASPAYTAAADHKAAFKVSAATAGPEPHVGTKSLLQHTVHADVKKKSHGIDPATVPWLFGSAIVLVMLTLSRHVVGLFRRVMHSGTQQAEPTEVSVRSPSSSVFNSLSVAFLGLLYIAFSTAIIKYNAWLMDGRFPFAVNLTCGHQASGFSFLFLMWLVKPATFKSIADPETRSGLDSKFLLRRLCPIGLLSSGTLVLSNLAYKFNSVAFLQMMKESNIVLVYVLAVLSGMELFNSIRARILLCLFLSTSLCVQGELAFDLHGFLIQGSSQFFESSRIVLQSVLLCAAAGKKLDPLSFNLMIQPVSGSMIAVFLCLCMTYDLGIDTASLADYAAWWPHLLLNAGVALGLNLSISTFIASTSGVGFVVLGIVKDVVIVLIDVLLSGTQISTLQMVAFSCEVSFVACYSLFKLFPEPESSETKDSEALISEGKENKEAGSTA